MWEAYQSYKLSFIFHKLFTVDALRKCYWSWCYVHGGQM